MLIRAKGIAVGDESEYLLEPMSEREHQNPKKNHAEVRDEIVTSDLLGCLSGNGGCARRRGCKRRDQGMGCAYAALAAARSGGGSPWLPFVHRADGKQNWPAL